MAISIFLLGTKIPTTYKEALEFAAQFNNIAKPLMAKGTDEQLGVPYLVWLLPLGNLLLFKFIIV